MSSDKLVIEYPVADIAMPDLLATVRAALDHVVRYGGTFRNWRAMVLPAMQNAGWWGEVRNHDLTGSDDVVLVDDRRLLMIYEINVRIAITTASWYRIQKQKDVLPYLRTISHQAYRNRIIDCVCGVPDKIILPVDHTYWQVAFPPNAPECRCHFEQVSERRMRLKGWTVTPESDIPSTASIAEDYRCNFGVRFPTDWQPTFIF